MTARRFASVGAQISVLVHFDFCCQIEIRDFDTLRNAFLHMLFVGVLTLDFWRVLRFFVKSSDRSSKPVQIDLDSDPFEGGHMLTR